MYFLNIKTSIRWDVLLIQLELHKRGRIQREAEQLLKELV